MAANESTSPLNAPHDIQIDLRQPGVAAVWAWLWPGAGHIYQGRYAKGILYMVCILGTYFFGLGMGSGHVVYASFSREDFRWHYFLQLGVGLPATPALVQYMRVRNDSKPILFNIMAPPRNVVPNDEGRANNEDELSQWHRESNMFFELGTLYTVVAGLLNVLAIYDAYAGPVVAHPEEEKGKRGPPDEES